MKSRFIILLLVLILFSSCSSFDQIEQYKTSNDTMTINLNQVCFNEKYGIKLQFDSIINDSRCPIGALCLWEGNAQIQFSLISKNKKHDKFYLNTHSAFTQDTIIHGIDYKLVNLLPHQKLGNTTNPQLHLAVVVATKQ